MKRLLVLVAALVVAQPMRAQERIKGYHTQVQIRQDGSIDVTEQITVHAEGNNIRRGIYRDFPTRYKDKYGNGVVVDLEVLGVERDGKQEPWFTENKPNGVRINTGNDDFLPVPADYTFTLRYRTTRQIGFFDDHDELYWNAIGTGWVFPIESGSVEVRLPTPVPADRMSVEAYTGPQGAKGQAYTADIPAPGVARYRLTTGLAPYEGFTTVVTFPKGLVVAPTQGDRTKWFLRDNLGVLVGLAGLGFLLLYMYRAWQAVGRDPEKGIIIARYEPRVGQTPAGLRYMQRMGYDMRCFTADVLALAVAGHLKIHREDKMFGDKWSLERIESPNAQPIAASQNALLNRLFASGAPILELKNTNAGTMASTKQKHVTALDHEYQPRYFKRNGKKIGVAVLTAAAIMIVAFITARGFAIPVIIAIGAVMLISIVVFGRLIRAPTQEGRELLDEIEGLKLYMKVAERDELASMRGPEEPPMDAARYEAMLPFAVALEVEDAWTDKFTAAVGAAMAAQTASSMGWYSGNRPISNLGDFSSAVGSSLSSSISSASTPPGGSSGSGGGGSSGGGGGGGGGGGR